MTADASILESGVWYPQSKRWGYQTLRTPVNYAYESHCHSRLTCSALHYDVWIFQIGGRRTPEPLRVLEPGTPWIPPLFDVSQVSSVTDCTDSEPLYCPYVQEELFQLPGLHTEVALIRDSLDTGTPDKLRILFTSIHSAVALLTP